MKVSRMDLLKVLDQLGPGVSSRSLLEQSEHILFTGQAAVSYNDEVSISTLFETGVRCSVKMSNLKQILSNMLELQIDVGLESNELKLSSEDTTAGLQTMPMEGKVFDLVNTLKIEDLTGKWKKLPKTFLEGAKLCSFSVAQEVSRREYTCVCARGQELLSTDALRISQFKMNETIDPFLLPAKHVDHLAKLGVEEYAVTPAWLHFKTKDQLVFSCRTLVAEFMDLSKFFEIEGVQVELPSSIGKLLESMSEFSEGSIASKKQMGVEFKGGKMLCSSQNTSGWVKKKFNAEYPPEVEGLRIFINPLFLSDILKISNKMTIGKGRALFQTESFRHATVLPKVDK